MKKWTLFYALLLVFVLSYDIPAVFAQGCPWMNQVYYGDGGYPGYRSWHTPWWKDLKEEQVKQFENLDKKLDKKIFFLRQEIRKKNLELKALLLEEKPNLNKTTAKQKEIFKIEGQLNKLLIEYQAETQKILPNKVYKDFLDWSNYWYCPMRDYYPQRSFYWHCPWNQ